MTALRRRLQRIEAALRPNSDANSEMTQAALGCLSDEDLDAFHDIVDKGTPANHWTEREASAVTAYTRAFEQHRLLSQTGMTNLARASELELEPAAEVPKSSRN